MSFDPSGSVSSENNLSYLNQEDQVKPIVVRAQRSPLTTDRRYKIGTLWINQVANSSFQLTSVAAGVANWVLLGVGAGDLETLTADGGVTISPDAAGDIILAGGTNLTTAGAGNTITFNMDASITLTSVTATSFETDALTAGLTISGNDIDADGTDINIDIVATPKGTGAFIVDVGDIRATESLNLGTVEVLAANNSPTSLTNNARVRASTADPGAGDPSIAWQVQNGGGQWAMGIDNSAADVLVIGEDLTMGVSTRMTIVPTTGEVQVNTGSLSIETAGQGLDVAEGANARMGIAILVAGTLAVATTAVTANSRIFLTSQVDGGSPGFLRVSSRIAATSFTILSSDAGDTSTVAWLIMEPA